MVSMTNNLTVKAKMEGSVGGALLRCCCTGESFFMTHFSVPPGSNARGDVLLAPAVPGEIIMLNLDGQTSWSIQPGSFLACDQPVAISTRMLNISQVRSVPHSVITGLIPPWHHLRWTGLLWAT